jgi:predicted transcriptional regulator
MRIASEWNPRPFLYAVSLTLEAADGPLTADEVAQRTEVRRSYALRALRLLVDDGHVTVTKDGRKRLHTIRTPYRIPDSVAEYKRQVDERVAATKAARGE